MRLMASQVAAATGGLLIGPDVEIVGVGFDSRERLDGAMFVAVVGERDGHDFVDTAVEGGARAALVSKTDRAYGTTVIAVDNTVDAFGALAADMHRAHFAHAHTVGVTGSVGKTTTKNFIAGCLPSKRVWANRSSFNNDQGLPYTVLNAPAGTEVLVLEMGMRGFGEIQRLCDIAPPTISVVTRIGEAHTERLGGIEGVARAKSEIVDALRSDGVAVLQANDRFTKSMAAMCRGSVVTFGDDGDVFAREIRVDDCGRASFVACSPWGESSVTLSIPGTHNVSNALAALAVAGSVGESIADAAGALGAVAAGDHRMVLHEFPRRALLIDDCYNANPTSMAAAFDTALSMNRRRTIAVCGLMAEVDDEVKAHHSVAQLATSSGIELWPADTSLYGLPPMEDLAARVCEVLIGGDVSVVVKGSRVAGLETLVERVIGSLSEAG